MLKLSPHPQQRAAVLAAKLSIADSPPQQRHSPFITYSPNLNTTDCGSSKPSQPADSVLCFLPAHPSNPTLAEVQGKEGDRPVIVNKTTKYQSSCCAPTVAIDILNSCGQHSFIFIFIVLGVGEAGE